MDGSTVWLDIDQVASLEQNPKEHDIGAIIASMQRWGYIDVIGWNKRTGRVLDGNGRLEALRKMKAAGMAAPARVVVEGNTWKAEFLQVDIDEKEEPLLAIALNRTNELGGWDNDELVKVLEEAAKEGRSLVGVGWDVEDIQQTFEVPPVVERDGDGETQPEDFWPIVRVKVSPETYQQYERIFGLAVGDTESDKFGYLLNLAERAME